MNVADYNWQRDSETERKFKELAPDSADKRSPFEHDRSRIIHSVAFRRLQGKTQIFAPGWADFMRTRVTHAIETAQIGRALAENAGIPGGLVEAACLAHDIGHPPFGHTGEAVLNELMEDYGGFEGNAQTFRILMRLERKAADYRGLNLCRATLLGILKYPYHRHLEHRKFLYNDDAKDYESWLFKDTPYSLIKSPKHQPPSGRPRTIVCQLMDWADDVAYSVHDLEDGLISGFLLPCSFCEDRFIDCVMENLNNAPITTMPTRDEARKILQELQQRLGSWTMSASQSSIREVTRYYINRFVTGVTIKASENPTSLFDFHIDVPPNIRCECSVLKAITFEFVIRDERTTTFVYKGREIVRNIFQALRENTMERAGRDRFELFPRNLRDHLYEARDDQSALARIVCDYVASMTDGQAIHLYRRLFEPTGGSPFEPV